MTTPTHVVLDSGVEIDVPLNKLKKSPRNARKVPHAEAAIEALAGSIDAKRMLYPLIVEPERGQDGEPTGLWLVTIGEGRRLAQKLRAKRGEIKRNAPIRCVVETALDAGEISLDENVTRSAMHPADEFEAFHDLAERKGYGPEEIGARFGVSAHYVRQRLRLGAVSPALMAVYRDGGLILDQLIAFAVSTDTERQQQVFDQLGPYNRSASTIRRLMTELKVPAPDRRAIFLGVDAYLAAGGPVLRDLFTEDRGGWLEDVGLLDRLVGEKLSDLAREIREREGWKWSEAYLDYPHGNICRRAHPVEAPRSDDDLAKISALGTEYDGLVETWAAAEDLPAEVEARLAEINTQLDAFGDSYAYRPEDVALAGVFVVLGHDGAARIERGHMRPEDVPLVEPAPDADAHDAGLANGAAAPEVGAGDGEAEDAEPDSLTPLSDRLVADLTAHRTMGLRDALADHPDAALLVLVHAAVLRTFYPGSGATCADLRFIGAALTRDAEGIEDSPSARRIAERHDAWARQLPQQDDDLWTFVAGLDGDSRATLLAHCVGLTLNAVHGWERRAQTWAHADTLAVHIGLDMTGYWTATAASYFGRITKAQISEAVTEGVSLDAAERMSGLKKPDMARAAEKTLAGIGWLPRLLRTRIDPDPAAGDSADTASALSPERELVHAAH